jgi:aryl-alcohol dehydrogenase-like predicted oxidoreductase
MEQVQLGASGPVVSRIGLGCMGMSHAYGPADRNESLATIAMAVERGVTLLDTGDFYGMGHNEMLIGEALKSLDRDKLTLSVKFGALRGPGGEWYGFDGLPAAVKTFAAYSLQRLGVEAIDVYRPARLDPNVPIEDTVGAIKDLIEAGYVRHVGLSEVGVETIRRAHAVHPIADLQIEYSLISRGLEKEILPTCRELGIAVTAYGVLSRGLISDDLPRESVSQDYRAHSPRFQGENLDRNLALVEALRGVAEARNLTPAQAAIAWVLSRGHDIVPLIGTKRRDRLEEALASLDVALSAGDLAAIEAAMPASAAAGARYSEEQMAMLDSERQE